MALTTVGLALAIQILCGFRLGEQAGQFAELVAWCLFVVAAVACLSPLGAGRSFLAGFLSFAVLVVAVGLNAHFASSLDAKFGGAYSWSGERTMVVSLFAGPFVGLIGAIVTAFATRSKLMNLAS